MKIAGPNTTGLIEAISSVEAAGSGDVVPADSALVLDLPVNNGHPTSVRYAKSPDQVHHPASLAKLMTALLAILVVDDLDHPVHVTAEDVRKGSGTHLHAGDELNLRDALHSLLIPSSNTVAEAIARTVGGIGNSDSDPREHFISLMNRGASDLAMTATRFTNPTGLHDPDMVTTARDILRLLLEVSTRAVLVDILGKRISHVRIDGTDQRVDRIESTADALGRADVYAGKTGTRLQEPAQFHVATLAELGSGVSAAVVVLGSKGKKARNLDLDALLDHVRDRNLGAYPGRAHNDAIAALGAETLGTSVGGSWSKVPKNTWRLLRAVRSSTAVKSRLSAGTLVLMPKAGRQLETLNRSSQDPGALCLLTEQELSDETSFPALRVGSVADAMTAIAAHHRARYEGKIVAITGSVGKSTTTSFTAQVLESRHLTYRPRSITRNLLLSIQEQAVDLRSQPFAVFEVSLQALPQASHLLRPDVAVVTAISQAHAEEFGALADIARSKAMIFAGLKEGGTAILNVDAPHSDVLMKFAREHAGRVITYGTDLAADVRLVEYERSTSTVVAEAFGRPLTYRLSTSGEHNAHNSLAVIATLDALGEDVDKYMEPFAFLRPVTGRGQVRQIQVQGKQVTLVDQSHNANPHSMRAALEDFAQQYVESRRVLVLGDMLELGPTEAELHADLLDSVVATEPAAVYLVGPLMTNLWHRLPDDLKGAHLRSIDQLKAVLTTDLRQRDAVLLKGSRDSGLEKLARTLRTESAREQAAESWRMTVHGDRVHAVGYRRWLRKRALEHGLKGWVRNCTDGTVEAALTGQSPALDTVLAEAHTGPRLARVRKIVTTRRKTTNTPTGFEIRADRKR